MIIEHRKYVLEPGCQAGSPPAQEEEVWPGPIHPQLPQPFPLCSALFPLAPRTHTGYEDSPRGLLHLINIAGGFQRCPHMDSCNMWKCRST